MNLLDNVYQASDRLEIEDTGNEILVYSPGNETTLYLNETAALVWRLCDGLRTGGQIVELLQEAYPEAQAEIQAQVLQALSDLAAKGIVDSVN